jgi:hypothetical protein
MQTEKQDIESALQMCECADYKYANLYANLRGKSHQKAEVTIG